MELEKRIIFVDNEQNALQGLKRMLRPMRNEWEMAFVENGEEALNLFKEKTFDVILTDYHMDGMNGVELLDKIKEQYSQTVRMIFSGEVNQSFVMKTVHSAHQFIAKPCSPEVLKKTIAHTCMLRHLLEDIAIRTMVSKIDTLPSIPSLYTKIMKELPFFNLSVYYIKYTFKYFHINLLKSFL